MRLDLKDVEKLARHAQEAPTPWRDWMVALIQDWIEMTERDVDAMDQGIKMGKSFHEGQRVVAQLDAIEEMLKLPLCTNCRKMIGGE
jgi:hypothetical protein